MSATASANRRRSHPATWSGNREMQMTRRGNVRAHLSGQVINLQKRDRASTATHACTRVARYTIAEDLEVQQRRTRVADVALEVRREDGCESQTGGHTWATAACAWTD